MKNSEKDTNFQFITNWHGSFKGEDSIAKLERLQKQEDAIYETLIKITKFFLVGFSVGFIYLVFLA